MLKIRFVILLLLTMLVDGAFATCSRDDVDYYLKKGFTRAQVAALCGEDAGAPASGNYRPYADTTDDEMRRAKEQRGDDDDYLREALDVRHPRVTPNWLEYVVGVCLAVINDPDVSAREEICPDVRYRIYFKDLEVKNYKRKYAFGGDREIKVIGRVKRKMLENLNAYPSNLRATILRSYKAYIRKDGTAIPVHEDARIKRVIGILTDRAREATHAPRRTREASRVPRQRATR